MHLSETDGCEGMFRIDNPLRHYAWGSSTHIPNLCGLPQTDDPVAEMWFGAHPSAPSLLEDGRTLLDAIGESPEEMLGTRTVASFGPRLPFLMKLLAAREPLSLQVHPTSERARIRFGVEDGAGIDRGAPHRSYPDAFHKPELVYALTRFEGMAGFRNPRNTAEILRRLQLPWLDDYARRLDRTDTPFQTLREVTSELLDMPASELEGRLVELKEAATRAEARAHKPPVRRRPERRDPDHVDREALRVYAMVVPLIDQYPTDPGVLVTLLLNHVVLGAGEAMFIDAGVVHAYTSGFGVEVMASSDNVVRAGLTPKHVDVEELLTIANFTPTPPPLWGAASTDELAGVRLAPPVQEFELLVGCPLTTPASIANGGPQVALCLDRNVVVEGESESHQLLPGQALFIPASERTVVAGGPGRLALARTAK